MSEDFARFAYRFVDGATLGGIILTGFTATSNVPLFHVLHKYGPPKRASPQVCIVTILGEGSLCGTTLPVLRTGRPALYDKISYARGIVSYMILISDPVGTDISVRSRVTSPAEGRL